MAELTIEALGLSKEELADRIVERAAARLLEAIVSDEDGNGVEVPTTFARAMEQQIKYKVDEAIDKIAGKHVLPNVASYVENLSLQATNQWGETSGKKVTFIEYLVQRAEAYLQEPVNFQGTAKRDGDSYGWRGAQTRVSHLVEKHLQYSIETAMKEALKTANASIVDGLETAVKMKLAEIGAKLKVEVKS